jgi:hypothetical protein
VPVRPSVSVVGVGLLLVGGACGKLRPGGASSNGKPPFEAFVAEYHPSIKAPAFLAPESLKKPWRVEMLQTDPRPFKNPRWKAIPIEAAGELEMPAGSSFRCLYNPLRIQASLDESLKAVASWHVAREVWCSNDGWRTHSATGLIVHYDAGGAPVRGMGDQAELVLFEAIQARPTKISILLRAN